MILAAGRGERMRPLTDSCPKPLLMAGDFSLIEHHILALKLAGIKDIVINTGWLGEQLPKALGDGERYGITITFSHEGYPPLETAGGIINALATLGDEDFILVNGDIYTDYDFKQLALAKGFDAHIVLIKNPAHNAKGDFCLDGHFVTHATSQQTFTYSGIAVYNSRFFKGISAERLSLKPLLDRAIEKRGISGDVFDGEWHDIGTVERLEALNKRLKG